MTTNNVYYTHTQIYEVYVPYEKQQYIKKMNHYMIRN